MAEIENIGRYKVLREIGRGGMARVYLAFDPQLQCNVALKVLAPHPNPEIQASIKTLFAKEAQILAQLNHPNVVRVFDLNLAASDPYISMEFVEGLTLAQFIRKNVHLGLAQRLTLFTEICRGVAAIHSKGVVHRDLKPDNIMISNAGDVKVMDFGIVEDFRGKNNFVAGTPAFMAPEQIASGRVDTHSDIFSLGVIGAILFSGNNPFQGSTLESVHERQLAGNVHLARSLPRPLRALLESCLALDPRNRPTDVESIVQLLKHPSSRAPWKYFSNLRAAGAFFALCALVFAASLVYRHHRRPTTELDAYYSAIEKCFPNCAANPRALTDPLNGHFIQLNCGDGKCSYLEKTCGLCAQDCGSAPATQWSARPACLTFATRVRSDPDARSARRTFDHCAFSSELTKDGSPQAFVAELVGCVRKFDNPVINDCAKQYLTGQSDPGLAATKFSVCIVKGPQSF